MTNAPEFLDKVERDMRFVRIDGAANGRKVVGNSDRKHFVPEGFNRIAHIELSLSQLALFFAKILQLASG
jgi:hypothetical protein